MTRCPMPNRSGCIASECRKPRWVVLPVLRLLGANTQAALAYNPRFVRYCQLSLIQQAAGMPRPPSPKVGPPPHVWPGGKTPARAVQRASAEAVFTPHARVLRAPPPPRAVAEELVPRPGGGFQLRSAERHTMTPPTGTFNFVRVHGETPHNRPLLVSAKLAHAQMAGGRPVVYAGTARFDRGEMAWWSNFSGTYQPIAAFRAQAGLPDDKFVPWQKLQMGGTAMQRGVFSERRAAGRPAAIAGMSDDGTTNGSPIRSGAAKQPAASMAGAAATPSGAVAAKPTAAGPGGAKSSAAVAPSAAKSGRAGGAS